MSDPVVTYVELAAVPQMMWQCPKCKQVCTTQDPRMIQPVGNFGQVEWECDCGHKGRLARPRTRLPDSSRRAERRRLFREEKKQQNKRKG